MLKAIAGILTGWCTIAALSAATFAVLINSTKKLELAAAKPPHRRRYYDV